MTDINYDLARIDRMVGEARITTDPADAAAIRHAAIVELLGAVLVQLSEINRKLPEPVASQESLPGPKTPKKKGAAKRAPKKKSGTPKPSA